MPTTLTHPEPPLTRADLARFDAWFQQESSLPDIARSLNLPITELADWAAQPHIKARLDAVKRVAEGRNELLHVEAKRHALFRLTSIITHAENNESSRKAATRILMTRLDEAPRRHAPPALPPRQPSADEQEPLDHQASTPASNPPSHAAPEKVAATQPQPQSKPRPLPLRPPDHLPPPEFRVIAPPANPIDLLSPRVPQFPPRPAGRSAAALFARAGGTPFAPASPDSS